MGQKQLLPVWEHLGYACWPRLAIPWKLTHWLSSGFVLWNHIWPCVYSNTRLLWETLVLNLSHAPSCFQTNPYICQLLPTVILPNYNCSLECNRHCLKDWPWLLQRRSHKSPKESQITISCIHCFYPLRHQIQQLSSALSSAEYF